MIVESREDSVSSTAPRLQSPLPAGELAAAGPRVPTVRQGLIVGLVLIVISAALVSWIELTPGSCPSCEGCLPTAGSTPIGAPPFALNTPIARGGPTNHSYLIEVVPGSGERWGSLQFRVTDASGSNVTPAADWSVLAFHSSTGSGPPIAIYDFPVGAWTEGSSVPITSGQSLALELGTTNLAGHGDKLVLFGVGPCAFSGQVSTTLP